MAPATCGRKQTATLLALGAAALSLWGTTALAFTNLVQNPSFENNGGAGQFVGSGFFPSYGGGIGVPPVGVPATSVSNWTVTGLGASIANIRDNNYLTQWPVLASAPLPLATSGTFYFQADGDIGGSYNVSISQMVNLIAGNAYQLSFDWAASPYFRDTSITSGWDITFGSDQDQVRASAGPNTFSGWIAYTKTFTPTSTGLQIVKFISSGTPAGMPPMSLLDNVQLREMPPVPGPLTVLGAAAAYGYSRHLRRRIRRD